MSQKILSRSMHITRRIGSTIIKINSNNKLLRYSPIFCDSFTRRFISNDGSSSIIPNKSTSAIENIVQDIPADVTPTNLLSSIPDAPLPPPAPEVLELAASLGEPSFTSLGLGGWSPIGIAQHFLEFIHVSCGMPWWATITIGTICVRTLLFPAVIIQQRNAAKLNNVLPGMQKIQTKISEARTTGDEFAAARATQELVQYMSKNNCSPIKSMIVPLMQAPIFISFFFGLKQMANLPVQSMTHGGLYWFSDLTITDPYFLLPMVTSATMYLTIKLGIDAPKMATMGMMRYGIQAIPVVLLPITMNFPSAIVWYWVSTNTISIFQVLFLKAPGIREYFKIPASITHAPKSLGPQKGFKEGFRDAWTNMKLAREMSDRSQLDNVQFNKAGRGPIPKTYVYNPTKDNFKRTQVVGKKI